MDHAVQGSSLSDTTSLNKQFPPDLSEDDPNARKQTVPVRVIEYHRNDASWRHEIKPDETVEFSHGAAGILRGRVVHKNQDGIIGVSVSTTGGSVLEWVANVPIDSITKIIRGDEPEVERG
jgi:hypothetical protein